MKYAYIKNGVVVDTCQVEPQTIFQADYARGFISAPDDVAANWTFDGTNFAPPPEPEPIVVSAPTKEELLAELQALTAKINALG